MGDYKVGEEPFRSSPDDACCLRCSEIACECDGPSLSPSQVERFVALLRRMDYAGKDSLLWHLDSEWPEFKWHELCTYQCKGCERRFDNPFYNAHDLCYSCWRAHPSYSEPTRSSFDLAAAGEMLEAYRKIWEKQLNEPSPLLKLLDRREESGPIIITSKKS